MMKYFLLTALMMFSSVVFAETSCPRGDYASLVDTWKVFQQVSLKSDPKEIAKFYKFPVKLYGPYDDDKPIQLSRNFFLQDYHSIFEQVIEGTDTELLADLKKTMDSRFVQTNKFGGDGCFIRYLKINRVADYYFVWNKKNGWLIEGVHIGSDYNSIEATYKKTR